jgi:hypothetical protein
LGVPTAKDSKEASKEGQGTDQVRGRLLIPSSYLLIPLNGGIEEMRVKVEQQLRTWVGHFVLSALEVRESDALNPSVQIKDEGVKEGPEVVLLIPAQNLTPEVREAMVNFVANTVACDIAAVKVLGVSIGSIAVDLEHPVWLSGALTHFAALRSGASFISCGGPARLDTSPLRPQIPRTRIPQKSTPTSNTELIIMNNNTESSKENFI